MQLLTVSLSDDPVLDVAVGAGLLEVAATDRATPPVFRIDRPAPTLSFGRLDRIRPGFAAAVEAARARGFEPTLRVGGGRAAAIHEGALSFGIAQPDDGSITTTDRFTWLAELVRGALARVGVAAERGQLPDEYCPGDWSLHAGGVKLAGLSQRVKKDATWTEGLLLVTGGDRAREVLTAVHAALQLPLDPATVGAVEDVAAGTTVDAVAAALRDELTARGPVAEIPLSSAALAAAERLRERHAVE
ncbi:lipoate--protein ligase family protein [Conexibacter woesei]|uniref:Lipoate-protein ligase A-like protein n=1 Tax=Conexibacter woesei (strain DSM 14684 / CCUG 47730 / CIP 108061 / JCM 11494 / NBRC 100937 / ID131577) TaxID=469383 RepID=D3FCB6_CONWI|nr:Lipoate-protein ligase A-like protein [Conexibacter woesei]ADB53411.1 Lipoate-protein ligase A-like protein [Conexibacter woesei DSM 14684]